MYRYRAFGLTIGSELQCPELRAGDGPTDVEITLLPAPEPHAPTSRPASGFDANPGHFELRVPGVGRFVVAHGRTILITPHPGVDDDDLRLFLLGTAVGALLQQRADLPLHGSAVWKDGQSLLILGTSGAGKSTLAAALGRHGWRLQSDDMSLVHLRDGRAWCEPGFPRQKMWPDMLKQLGFDPASHARVRAGIEKRSVIIDDAHFHDAPAPVAAIVALGNSRASSPVLTPVDGPARMTLLKRQTFRANLRAPLQMHLPHFEIIAQLAAQVRVWHLQRPRSGGSPTELAEFLVAQMEASLASQECQA